MKSADFPELFKRYLQGTCTAQETAYIMEQIAARGKDSEIEELVHAYWNQLNEPDKRYTKAAGRHMLNNILNDSLLDDDSGQFPEGAVVHTISRMRTHRWWWAAATLILVLGSGIFLWKNKNGKAVGDMAKKSHDILPGKNGAVLTLADGSQIVLDTVHNSVVAQQSGVTAKVLNGMLTYAGVGNNAVFNTMSTPVGRQYHMVLPDGTHAWLNAASSIRYPITFSGKERKIEVTGEVYLEVAKNTQQPFKVSVNNKAFVEVLGTHFNINAYDNEEKMLTTLLDGSVRVVKDASSVLLQPGQQAQLNTQTPQQLSVHNNIDVEKVMAWRNGLFDFKGIKLAEVMRQLERWYNITVVYEAGVPDITFWGKMPRDLTLNNLLDALQKTDVHFRIEGTKLIVLP